MGQYWLVLVGTWAVWCSIGSLWGGIRQYLVVMGQYREVLMTLGRYGAVLASTLWYLVSVGRYWLVLGVTGSV